MCIRVQTTINRFRHDVFGGITAFTLMIFLLMVISVGMGIDFMRHETFRAELQNAMDRGVLAAASVDQTVDAETTIRGFVNSTNFTRNGYALNVVTTPITGGVRVDATASYDMQTYFLKMVGIPTLSVVATGAALEARNQVEISLALDISGSMRFNNRLTNLQEAAGSFVETILANPNDSTSMNLIPYAGQVNVGQTIFDAAGGSRDHAFSTCLEFDGADFDHDDVPSGYHDQVPNFHYWALEPTTMDWGWCPSDDQAVMVGTQDATALKTRINSIRLHDGTGTQNAMKWALALLNPSSSPLFGTLATAGEVDTAFNQRPLAWDLATGMKVIVLMTDGQITDQFRPDDATDPDLETEELQVYGHSSHKKTTRSTNLQRFYDMCDDAKTNGVIIFTIALEAPSNAQTEMQTCATSDAHYFNVDGAGLEDAFSSIAGTIQKLKLVN